MQAMQAGVFCQERNPARFQNMLRSKLMFAKAYEQKACLEAFGQSG